MEKISSSLIARSTTIRIALKIATGSLLVGLFFILTPPHTLRAQSTGGATLYVTPSGGTVSVGETFTVTVSLNSGNDFINAVEANLTFPADKLQVVEPSTKGTRSFIEVWVGQPAYSNSSGTLHFAGTVPNPGIKISQGLISTVTFRVKSTGRAAIRFTEDSKVLLNDGKGTNVLIQTNGGIFSLVLPPPAGPTVSSRTHPDQSRWYPERSAVLLWTTDELADGYSYIVDDTPLGAPDDIPEAEGQKQTVRYGNLADGNHYFHIKALRAGVWGGTTHYAMNIDGAPPAEFRPEVAPGRYTTSRRPVISFTTTDALSGMSHYEIKLVNLSARKSDESAQIAGSQGFFVETTSPYIPELSTGKYDVLIRAYDTAGNFREMKDRVNITSIMGTIVGLLRDGIWWLLIALLIIAAMSVYVARHYRKWHTHLDGRLSKGAKGEGDLRKKLDELQAYQRKYGHLVIVFFGLLTIFSLSFSPSSLLAAEGEQATIPTPIVTTRSESIANNEIFYIGGKQSVVGSAIKIYLQNEQSGETIIFDSETDKKGDWFYSHSQFLPVGNYSVWVQARLGDIESPPSGNFSMLVFPTALEFGTSRISYETIYFVVALLLFFIILIMLANALYHYYHGKRKHVALLREIQEAEESIKRGFAVLRKDIAEQLKTVKRAVMDPVVANEERIREEQLIEDLEIIERRIGKEVWDVKARL